MRMSLVLGDEADTMQRLCRERKRGSRAPSTGHLSGSPLKKNPQTPSIATSQQDVEAVKYLLFISAGMLLVNTSLFSRPLHEAGIGIGR
jgi:hypothetical protein